MSEALESDNYNLVSKIIHWGMAVIILGLLFVGFYMASLEAGDYKYWLYDMHKSFGVLVLILAVLRVVWHVLKRRPKHIPSHKKWEVGLSHLMHLFLYIALFALPLSGWLMSSSGGYAVKFFGLELPVLLGKDKAMLEFFREWHTIIAMGLFFVIGLHMLGAFKHHFIDRDATLQRMTIKSLGLIGGIVILLFAILAYAPTGFFVSQGIIGEVEHDSDEDHGH